MSEQMNFDEPFLIIKDLQKHLIDEQKSPLDEPTDTHICYHVNGQVARVCRDQPLSVNDELAPNYVHFVQGDHISTPKAVMLVAYGVEEKALQIIVNLGIGGEKAIQRLFARCIDGLHHVKLNSEQALLFGAIPSDEPLRILLTTRELLDDGLTNEQLSEYLAYQSMMPLARPSPEERQYHVNGLPTVLDQRGAVVCGIEAGYRIRFVKDDQISSPCAVIVICCIERWIFINVVLADKQSIYLQVLWKDGSMCTYFDEVRARLIGLPVGKYEILLTKPETVKIFSQPNGILRDFFASQLKRPLIYDEANDDLMYYHINGRCSTIEKKGSIIGGMIATPYSLYLVRDGLISDAYQVLNLAYPGGNELHIFARPYTGSTKLFKLVARIIDGVHQVQINDPIAALGSQCGLFQTLFIAPEI